MDIETLKILSSLKNHLAFADHLYIKIYSHVKLNLISLKEKDDIIHILPAVYPNSEEILEFVSAIIDKWNP
jgi:hypothetical protein